MIIIQNKFFPQILPFEISRGCQCNRRAAHSFHLLLLNRLQHLLLSFLLVPWPRPTVTPTSRDTQNALQIFMPSSSTINKSVTEILKWFPDGGGEKPRKWVEMGKQVESLCSELACITFQKSSRSVVDLTAVDREAACRLTVDGVYFKRNYTQGFFRRLRRTISQTKEQKPFALSHLEVNGLIELIAQQSDQSLTIWRIQSSALRTPQSSIEARNPSDGYGGISPSASIRGATNWYVDQIVFYLIMHAVKTRVSHTMYAPLSKG
ncbi:hypothetical protein C8R43DRAFT_709429 [Mycena crocata]|nr:hypothetical protein C8R43DRAFT_709429 [Mycena crocata]